MSRSHSARPGRPTAPSFPAVRHTGAASAAPPVHADAHARFGHHYSQIALTAADAPQDTAPIQREAEDDSEGEMQLKAEGGVPARPDVPVATGGGSPLPPPVQNKMEGAFGHSFADVRVHSGSEAHTVGALAYTRGTDIHFQPGLYDPSSAGGQELLGHELAHVVQQSAGRVATPGGAGGTAPINADASLEAEADSLGRRAAQGEAAPVIGAGSGIQRKAIGDAPIQRDEDDADPFRTIDLNAAPRPNEFLPNRRVTPPANNSPERGSTRKNPNGTTFQPDVPRVQTFANRMAGEMTTQKNMLAANDALPADVDATEPTIPNPKGFDSFQTEQRSEREKELDALRNGTLGSEPARTDAKGAALVNRNGVVPKTSGEFEQPGLPLRPLHRPAHLPWNPARPGPVTTPIAPSKPVTEGTTKGKTAYNGGEGDETATRSSAPNASRLGWLEDRLNHPSQSTAFVDNHGGLKYPREPMAARQQHLMQTAEKADPLMRDLDATNNLPHHVDKNSRTGNNGFLFAGDRVGGGKLTNNANEPYYAVGATQFTNVQKLVPTLTGAHGPANVNNEMQSRTNLWSEADVDPVKVTNTGVQNGNRWANLGNRGTDRLLHTAANSQAETQNGRGGTTPKPIDYRYQVTNDHYKTAVPIAPVQEDYALNHPYNSPLMPPQPAPLGQSPTSLGFQQSLAETGMRKDAGDHAEAVNELHNASQENRDLAEIGVKQQGSAVAYAGAGKAAGEANTLHNASQENRDLAEIGVKQQGSADAYTEAASAAKTASYNRNADENERVKVAGMVEDFETNQAYQGAEEAALKANAKHEAEEEAHTQADLKALAPSDSIQSMYGMGKGGAKKWAAQQMEQQHLGVQEFLKSGVAQEPVAPMSEAASDMYG